MIEAEAMSPCALKIVPSEKLTEADFHGLAPQVDAIISKFGQARLLIDVSAFNGWESYGAFQAHASFIKNHQRKVERIAVIVGHDWQHWLVVAVRMFLHPDARAFDKSAEHEARRWVVGPKSRLVVDDLDCNACLRNDGPSGLMSGMR